MKLNRRQQTMSQLRQRQISHYTWAGEHRWEQSIAGMETRHRCQMSKNERRKRNWNHWRRNRLQDETGNTEHDGASFTWMLIFHGATRINVHSSFLGPMKQKMWGNQSWNCFLPSSTLIDRQSGTTRLLVHWQPAAIPLFLPSVLSVCGEASRQLRVANNVAAAKPPALQKPSLSLYVISVSTYQHVLRDNLILSHFDMIIYTFQRESIMLFCDSVIVLCL